MTFTGGCRCGASRYTLALAAAPPVYCCHCTDCQRWSGSAFTEHAPVPDNAITATGPIIDAEIETPSGARQRHRVCGTCHTRLWNTNDTRPGIATVRAGTLDGNTALEPRLHIWTVSKQPWVVLRDDLPVFDRAPPMAEFIALLSG